MGVPVITTDMPGCRDAVEDGTTGFLCEPRSVDSLEDTMTRMLDLSPDERLSMGAAARAKMEQEFDETFVHRAYLDALRQAWRLRELATPMFNLSPGREKAAPRGPRGQRAYVVGDVHGRARPARCAPRRRFTRTSSGGRCARLFSPSSATSSIADRTRRKWSSAFAPTGIPACARCSSSAITRRFCCAILARRRRADHEMALVRRRPSACRAMASMSSGWRSWMTRRLWPLSERRFQARMSSSSRASSIAAGSAIICSSTPGSGQAFALEEQLQSDLRWIRQAFLLDETDHGFVVVHGHTISSEVEERPNRIGIDTGAYQQRRSDGSRNRGWRALVPRYAMGRRRGSRCRGLIWTILVLTGVRFG